MPELPEVEVTAQRLRTSLLGATFAQCRFGVKRLRHPFPKAAVAALAGQPVVDVRRRAKYLMIEFPQGWLVVHLGMSGVVQLKAPADRPVLHDHVRMAFVSPAGKRIDAVFNDPRRFGSVRWMAHCSPAALDRKLSASPLGMEPLQDAFHGDALYEASRGKNVNVKQWLLAGRAVVGVGNIYASEALFDAGISPRRKAGSLSRARCDVLAQAIKKILKRAIHAGGTTLQDFVAPDGAAGRYGQSHQVYDREGLACPRCGHVISRIVQQQRSTYFCRGCQR